MELWVVDPTVTDQFVPVGRPVSDKISEYCPEGRAVKVMGWDAAAPLTVMDPDEGAAVYPAMAPTEKG